MQYDTVTMSYTILYVFNHHHLRPLKWLARVSDDEVCVSHCIPTYSHEKYMLCTVHCAAARAVRTSLCAAPPPTHSGTINLYLFKGSVAHRPPFLHPESPLELICTPTVPLGGHCHRCLRESETLQVQNPPPPAPCMARTKRPVATRTTQ